MEQNAAWMAESQKGRQRNRYWRMIVTGLAAIVVFCTTYALILPAITISKEYMQEQQNGLPSNAAVQDTGATSGSCGENVTWKLSDDGTLTISGTGKMTNFASYSGAPWYSNRDAVTKVVIGEGVTSIGENAFRNCGNLSGVTIPEGVTSVGNYAFGSCYDLISVELPNSVTSMGYNVFYECSQLTSVVLPQNITKIDDSTFNGCGNLTSVEIPASVTSIGSYAFKGCSKLTGVTIPDSVTNIGSYAFQNCTGLTGVTIPVGVKTINRGVFQGCTGLTGVTIPASVTNISSNAFQKCTSLTGMTIPASVTSISSDAFQNCTGLKRIDVDAGNKNYSSDSAGVLLDKAPTKIIHVPAGISGDYTIPEGVKSIPTSAFFGCSRLTSVTIPDSVITIESSAFKNCSHLTRVNIPEHVTTIGVNAFSGCDALTTVYWNAADVTSFSNQEINAATSFEVVFGKTMNKLSKNTFDQLLNMGASAAKFEADPTTGSYLTIEKDVAADFLPPSISGRPEDRDYYVSPKGVYYRILIDEETGNKTARLAYYPVDRTEDSYVVLKNPIGSDIPIKGVSPYAFYGSQVKALTFEAPEQIDFLGNFAFYNAKELTSINGAKSAAEVLDSFPYFEVEPGRSDRGVLLFENTKISSPYYPTKEALEYKEGGFTLTINPPSAPQEPKDEENNVIRPVGTPPDDDQKNLYYTGQEALTKITIETRGASGTEDYVARVCVRFDSTQGGLGREDGIYEILDQSGDKVCDLNVKKVPDQPNCYRLDFSNIQVGKTATITITSVYPSGTSRGGTASIWGCILTKEEAAEYDTKMKPLTSNYHQLRWETKTDEHKVEKNLVGEATVAGDGEDGAILESLTWNINLIREEGSLEGYGRDNIKSIDFTDTLTLPAGAVLSQELMAAIRDESYQVTSRTGSDNRMTYSFSMPDGSKIIELSVSRGTGASLGLTDGKLTVRFRVQNNDTTKQIQNVAPTLTLNKGFVHMGKLTEGATYQISNDIKATVHYMYSDDKDLTASCTSGVKVTEGSLVLSKTVTNEDGQKYQERPMGSTVWFTITAANPGYRHYTDLGSLKDPIPDIYYLSPEQLAELFRADDEHQLTVTISNAAICDDGFTSTTVTGIDGSTTGQTSLQNTGNELLYNGKASSSEHNCDAAPTTITLSWGGTKGIQIKVGETKVYDCALAKESIQQALDNAGFLITSKTQYTLEWQFAEDVSVKGGSQIQKKFAVTAKDTFMNLTADQPITYNKSKSWYNYAYAYDKNGQIIAEKTHEDVRFLPEFTLSKSWFFKDTNLGEGDAAKKTRLKQGDVLDYHLKVTHKGVGSYDLLPLVDRMTGGQALLVPCELNRDADWAKDLTTRTVDGKEYYLLTKEGNYSHVWTAQDQMADSVEVTKNGNSLDTLIKWYFTGYSGDRENTIHYQSMVCPGVVLYGGMLSYELGNEAWLNDHPTHRLHHSVIGWSGAVFDIDKAIVSSVNEVADEKSPRSSIVADGQSVVYCLTLFNTPLEEGGTAPELTIWGADMSDILPVSVTDARWIKNVNVKLTYGEGCIVKEADKDKWSVTEAGNTDQQSIRWSDDFSITFSERACIYVTLTYPSGAAWDSFASQVGERELVNTFKVMNSEVSVTHTLKIQGKVRLQKSVYVSGYYNQSFSTAVMSSTDALFHYSNDTFAQYQVQYYVTLYNGGKTRLYLQDMQDQLPRGFTCGQTKITAYASSAGNRPADVYDEKGNLVTLRLPSITATAEPEKHTAGETQRITFHFSKYGSSSNKDAINYDEALGLCYLEPGEAILFTYTCYTHEQADTDIVATNTIAMPYKDLTGAGVVVDEGAYSNRWKRGYGDQAPTFKENHGDCRLQTTAEVAQQYGFIGGDENTRWLTSQVTVTRGQIKPSITKKLTGATDADGNARDNLTWVDPNDTVTWTVTATNEGIYQMQDYVLTDVMETPYSFIGEVTYQIVTGSQKQNLNLFKITGWMGDQATIRYSTNGSSYNETANPTVNGQFVEWANTSNGYDYHVSLAFSRDGKGNTVMSIRLRGKSVAIPAGGSGTLKLSTKNMDKVQQTKQFVNTVYITPMGQEWDGNPSNGSKVQWQNVFDTQARSSVQNTAQVMVSMNAGTSSTKAVTQKGDPNKTAISTGDTNYIRLDDVNMPFDYILSVTNGTSKPIKELVLIDALPQVGDHSVFNKDLPRYSEFKVKLADVPNFTVKVKLQDDTEITLKPEQYTIEYTTKTEFNTDDWNGNGISWTNDLSADIRSIRLTIKDESGRLIPANSTISLSFTCQVDVTAEGVDAALPGEIAWNRFGYQYKDDEDSALQAGPLKVGVKIPEMPKLIKKLVDSQGNPIAAAKDESFSFLFYEGEALTGSYQTKEDLIAALDGKNFWEFTLTVPEGKSESEAVYLKPQEWTLTAGQSYTLVELSNNSDYVFDSMDSRKTKSITFQFKSDEEKIIVCKNMSLAWEAKVLKEDESHKRLASAVFALYSPKKSDYTVPGEYAALNVPLTIERDGKTWHLYSIESTDAEGTACWPDLREDHYYLVEVKAPDGYHLPQDNARLLSREKAEGGVAVETVVNYSSAMLPSTGGMGTTLFYVLGSILFLGAAVLLITKKRMSAAQ